MKESEALWRVIALRERYEKKDEKPCSSCMWLELSLVQADIGRCVECSKRFYMSGVKTKWEPRDEVKQ